jgi:hypothetical protein
MKSKFLFLIAILAVFAAFKKITGVEPDMRIKKIVSLKRPQDSTSYSYTSQGKISSYNNYWSEMWQKFEYSGNKVIERGDGPSRGHPYTNTYYLNRQGRADSMVRIVDKMKFCIYFKYDKDGFRVEELSGCDTKVVERRRVIKGGNVVKQIFYEQGKEVEAGYFDYYTDKANIPTMFGEELLGYSFRGRDSKNLLKQIVLVKNMNDTVLVNTPIYHFDEKGRITTVAIYGKTGILADSLQYIY